MIYEGAQTIYQCLEHEPVQVPLERLLGPDGKLKIYPEVAGKGFFDIDYRDGQLFLRSTRYVGLIPLCEDAAIHVRPRAPIANLMRMIERAGTKLVGLSPFVRGYEERLGSVDSPEDLYVHAFTSSLRPVLDRGVLKRYIERTTDRELRGRLLLSDTVSRFRSRGMAGRTRFAVTDLTIDTPENQIVKHIGERLLRHFMARQTAETRLVARELAQLLAPFSTINTTRVNAEFIAGAGPALIRGLPRSHGFYEPVLWLAYLISTRSGIVMEQIGRARFETLIIDVAGVFENYVRTVIEDALGAMFPDCRVLDGNVHQVPLFADTKVFKTQPDYYFRRGRTAIALADAKYKAVLSSADRYELLGFCEALGVSRAAFVVPKCGTQPVVSHVGTTARGRKLKVVAIDLGAGNLADEEAAFVRRLGEALELARDFKR